MRMTWRSGVVVILEGSPNGTLCLDMVEKERGWGLR